MNLKVWALTIELSEPTKMLYNIVKCFCAITIFNMRGVVKMRGMVKMRGVVKIRGVLKMGVVKMRVYSRWVWSR